jgi:hypothetical protein
VLERSQLILNFLLNLLQWVRHGVVKTYPSGADWIDQEPRVITILRAPPFIIDGGELRLQETVGLFCPAVEKTQQNCIPSEAAFIITVSDSCVM